VRRLVALVLLAIIVAGCTPAKSPASVAAPEPGSQAVLSVENRGGPALSIRVNGAEVLQLTCNDARLIEPGVNGVPPLPWTVTVARIRNDVLVATQPIADLPEWYLQIGDASLGFGKTPPAGPAGPSCPPGE
jgi:hypothetical protein